MVQQSLKPGYKTSEFAMGVVASAIIGGLTIWLGNPSDAQSVFELGVKAVQGVGAIFTIAVIAISFMQGRRDLKTLLVERGVIQPTLPTSDIPTTPTPEIDNVSTPFINHTKLPG